VQSLVKTSTSSDLKGSALYDGTDLTEVTVESLACVRVRGFQPMTRGVRRRYEHHGPFAGHIAHPIRLAPADDGSATASTSAIPPINASSAAYPDLAGTASLRKIAAVDRQDRACDERGLV
jgi:hypothetical protein